MRTKGNLLFFIVHGIGKQKRLPKNVESLRKTASETLTECSDGFLHINKMDFLYIEYHSILHGLPQADSRAELAMLDSCSLFRNMIKECLCDPLYYFTPHFAKQIRRMVTIQLNEQYESWKSRNSDWENWEIAILAHSLGGVICFDILDSFRRWTAKQNINRPKSKKRKREPNVLDCTDESDVDNYETRVNPSWKRHKFVKLDFLPRYLFMMGSPYANCLVLRNHDIKDYQLPKGVEAFNLFHPFDPLGYRLEPLYDKSFKSIPPVVLSKYAKPFHVRLWEKIPAFPQLSLQLPQIMPQFPQLAVQFPQFSVQFPQVQFPQLPIQFSFSGDHPGNVEINTSQLGFNSATRLTSNHLTPSPSHSSPSSTTTSSSITSSTSSTSSSSTTTTTSVASSTTTSSSSSSFSSDTIDPNVLARLPNRQRLDFQLPSKFADNLGNEYLIGLRAHFWYWSSKDMVYFVLNQMQHAVIGHMNTDDDDDDDDAVVIVVDDDKGDDDGYTGISGEGVNETGDCGGEWKHVTSHKYPRSSGGM